MPIFNYTCECGHSSEELVKKSDDVVTCPKCEFPMIKQLSAPMFTINGVGAYNSGCFPKAKDGPKIPQEILNMSDAELDKSLGLT